MGKIKVAAAFFEAVGKLTSGTQMMTKAMLSSNSEQIDAAITKLQEAVDAFREARKTIETP